MALSPSEYYGKITELAEQIQGIKNTTGSNLWYKYGIDENDPNNNKEINLAKLTNELNNLYAQGPETEATTAAKNEAAALKSQIEAMQKEKQEAATAVDPLNTQKRLSAALEAQAKGETPSLAEAQMKATAEKTLAQQLAAAGAARGGNQAALQRQLAKSQMASSAAQSQEAAQLRLQEQQQAQQLLAQNLASAAGYQLSKEEGAEERKLEREKLAQDYELTKAGYISQQYMQEKQRQASLTGGLIQSGAAAIGAIFSDKRVKKDIKSGDKKIEAFLAALEKQKFSDGGIPKLRSSLTNMQDTDYLKDNSNEFKIQKLEKPDLKIEEIKEPSFFKNDTIDFAKSASENIAGGGGGDMLSSIMGMVGGSGGGGPIASMFKAEIPAGSTPQKHQGPSIKRHYEDGGTVSEDEKTKQFLDALKAYEYKYKNPNTPYSSEGNQMSVMAQDLEKTELGKHMVEELPDGTKLVNYGKGFGTILAAQANLNKRLEELEKKKSRK